MEVRFWLLDVSAERIGERDEIWLWGITDNGRRCTLIEESPLSRFYLTYERRELAERAFEKIKSIGEVVNCTLTVRRCFGREMPATEITCKPSSTDRVIKSVKDLGGTLFEDDIRPSNRYMLDNDLSPSSWYTADVDTTEPIETLDGVDVIYRLRSLKPFGIKMRPSLRVVGVDFLYYSGRGTPKPESDPIVAISLSFSDGRGRIITGDEHDILAEFMGEIREFNPDVIVGFKTNTFHWPYLIERGKKVGVLPKIGKTGSEPHQSLFGHFSIAGRINFDLRDYVDDIAVIQRKTLEELAKYLGLPLEVKPIDKFFLSTYWRDNSKRGDLLEYVKWRAETCLKIFNRISDEVFSISSITGMPADYVFTASPAFRLENFLMRAAVKLGELIPKVTEKRAPSYPGGKVLAPRKGLHREVAVVDFKAMYPSLMLKYNISPDTVTRLPCDKENVIVIEEANTCVDQNRKGFFTGVLEILVRERDKVREAMKQLSPRSHEYRLLDATQKTLKVLANAMYGYMAWVGARWYLREGAETVAALGRRTITEAIKKARGMGLDVIYGDTDSLFIKYDENKIKELLKWINDDLGLEAKIDKIYKSIIFTEAKKRYAGITDKGELDIVGLEAVRGDWCDYARETQRRVVEMVLRGEKKDKILSYIRERSSKLKRREVDIMELVIWKQLAKRIEEYEVNAPHVVVATQLIEDGWTVEKGDFVGFVVTIGSGPIYARAKHYAKAKLEEIDVDYYVEKQLIPVCTRVLSPVGIGVKEVESTARMAGLGMEAFF